MEETVTFTLDPEALEVTATHDDGRALSVQFGSVELCLHRSDVTRAMTNFVKRVENHFGGDILIHNFNSTCDAVWEEVRRRNEP